MSVESGVVSGTAVARGRSPRIYLVTAVLFFGVAAVGFAPNVVGIVSGARPSPPLFVHVHAALMASWLVLFLMQTALVAADRRQLHRTLGCVSVVLAPAMVALMAAVTIVPYFQFDIAGLPETLRARGVAFSLFVQGRGTVLFAIFYIWAIRARRTDTETHKRMMVMATLVIIDAAIGRMGGLGWLPGAPTDSYADDVGYDAVHCYQLMLLAPVVIHDMVRLGRVHRAYVIGVGLFLPFILATHFAWTSAWWRSTVTVLTGAHR